MKRYQFGSVDRRRLEKALGEARDARFYRRLLAALLVARGMAPPLVARLINHHARSVARWVQRYLSRPRVTSLKDAPRSGRPRQAKWLKPGNLWRELQHNPLRAGYPRTVWTVDLLGWELRRRSGQPLSARTLRRRLKERGLRWKRLRHVYGHREPHPAQKKGLSFASLNKGPKMRWFWLSMKLSGDCSLPCVVLGLCRANRPSCPSRAAMPSGLSLGPSI